MRKQMEEAKKALQQQSQSMNPEDKQAVQDAGKQIEFDADVKETEERKNVAGQEARRVILTIAMREKGKTLEEGGGLVLTNDMWLAARVPAMEELQAFYVSDFKAVFEGTFTGMDACRRMPSRHSSRASRHWPNGWQRRPRSCRARPS